MADSHDAETARWKARAGELEVRQWELERRVFQLETLAAIAREAGACHSLETAARSVLNVLSGTFGAVSGAVLFYDEDEDAWSLAAARGIPAGIPPPEGRSGEALADWLAAHPTPESPAVLAGAGLDALAGALGTVSLAAPICGQGAPVGLILLGETLSGEALDAGDLELCAAAAAAAASLYGDILSTERYLRQQQERFRIRGIFEQYCAPDVVERLLAEHDGVRIGTEQKVISVLMADIRGFTSWVLQADPEEITAIVNAYFGVANDTVWAYGGTMDSFMGDGVLAVFGDPVGHDDDAARAVRCAVEMQQRFDELVARWSRPDLALGLGIGVTTGKALCGVFGSARRFLYTVLGPPVNLASRLSNLTQSDEILLDRYTYERVSGWARAEALAPMSVKGFDRPISVFRLCPGTEP